MLKPDWIFNRENDSQGVKRELARGVTARLFCGIHSMLSVVRVDPHSRGDLHSHPEEQWGVLLEGECVRIQNGQEVAVVVGDFWHTPGNTPHGIRTGENGAVILDIFSPPREDYRGSAASTRSTAIKRSLIEELSAFGSALLHDAAGGTGALPSTIRPLDRQTKLCGPAFTVACPPGDNLWLHRAVYAASPGDVLVASTGRLREVGYWGELLGVAASARELGGLVIDGCVRDSDELRDFPVFATGRCIRGASKSAALAGLLGRAVRIGDCTIRPGDLIVGDADGVVALRREEIETVLDTARKRVTFESEIRRQLRKGKRSLDLLQLE